MSWIVTKLIERKIPDSQCGMRLIHKSVFDLDLQSDNFQLESEILLKTGLEGWEIVSVPIKCIYYKGRKSKINSIKDTFRFFKMLFKILMEI